MAKHRTPSIDFKRQVVQEYLAGETFHGLARRHELSRTLIRIWVDKYETGACSSRDPDAERTRTPCRSCSGPRSRRNPVGPLQFCGKAPP